MVTHDQDPGIFRKSVTLDPSLQAHGIDLDRIILAYDGVLIFCDDDHAFAIGPGDQSHWFAAGLPDRRLEFAGDFELIHGDAVNTACGVVDDVQCVIGEVTPHG